MKVVCNLFSLILILHLLVPSSDLLYIGRMYHVKKEEVGHWKTIYSVVRDLDVLKQVFVTIRNYYFILMSAVF